MGKKRKQDDTLKFKFAKDLFMSDIFVPIIQNLIGGISIGILHYLYLTSGVLIYTPMLIPTTLFSAILFFLITNVLRFAGDELGLYKAAYLLGRKSVQHPVNSIVYATELPVENAELMLKLHYNNKIPISEKAMKQYIKFNGLQYQHALNLLVETRVLKNKYTTQASPQNLGLALNWLHKKA